MSIGDDAVRPRTVNPLSAIALAIVATLGALYVVSQFIRNSIGVIAPNLAVEMALTPLDLGFLSSIYFFVFAATQIPLGVALDRFGPKLCMLVCVGFTVLGCAMFAAAHSAGSLVVARALLGFGTASFLMAPCALYARWFPPERFSTFTGIHLGLGTLGALLATAPLAFATAAVGWRATFLGIGAAAALIGAVIWLIVRDDPPGVRTEPHHETLKESFAGIWDVIRTPSMGRVFFAQVAIYPSYLLVASLWGGPYLTHVYGYDLAGRGDILFLAALAQVLGSFLWGPTDRWFGSCKTPVLISMAGLFGALLLFALASPMPFPLLLIAFVMLGFFTGPVAPVLTHGRLLAAPRLFGRTITLLNIGAIGGGFLVQFISGALIDLFPMDGGAYPLAAYRLVFGLQAGLVLIGFIIYFRSLDRRLDQNPVCVKS
jgi:sugar phosphate permease